MENTELETKAEFNNAWKGRGSLRQMVDELKRQKETRIDFVADTDHFGISCNGGVKLIPKTSAALEWMPDGTMEFNRAAHHQLATKCHPSIPTKFFDNMLEERPQHLTELINGLHKAQPKKRLVRCLDNKVRAWLGNSYLVVDNYDMAFTCLEEAQKHGGQVFEADLSDYRMRIKFTSQSVYDAITIKQSGEGGWYAAAMGNRELIGKSILGAHISEELPGGPGTIHPVVTVLNSETGHGGFYVRIGILMGICFNVATLETVVSRVHVGQRLEDGIYSEETRSIQAKSIMLMARDNVRAAFDQGKFSAMVAKAKGAQAHVLDQPTAAVNNIVEAGLINEEQREAVLEYFLRDYDSTRFGLAQAVSRLAQDIDDPDQAGDFEDLAGRLIKEPALVTA